MAQIKKIVKPGDLIRGAAVGLAGLDKDGNVIGYKAAAADAGKVLTVGEDGSVAPAEGGGGSKYMHILSFKSTTHKFSAIATIINDDETPFTQTDLIAYLTTIGVDNVNGYPFTGWGFDGANALMFLNEVTLRFGNLTFLGETVDGQQANVGDSGTLHDLVLTI